MISKILHASKILSIIGLKKELPERKIGEKKSKIDWSLEIYLKEIQAELLANTGAEVWPLTLCHFLQGKNFSHQKLRMVVAQRDDDLPAQFIMMLPAMSLKCWYSWTKQVVIGEIA